MEDTLLPVTGLYSLEIFIKCVSNKNLRKSAKMSEIN